VFSLCVLSALDYNRAMFAHLRYLAALCFVLMIGGAIFVTLYARDFKQTDLETSITKQVEATVASYITTVWDRYGAQITTPGASPESMGYFLYETQRFFQSQPFLKVAIYSTDGKFVYFPNPLSAEYPTSDGITRIGIAGLSQAAAGKPNLVALPTVYMTGGQNPTQARSMLQATYPLKRTVPAFAGAPAPAQPDGVIEIFVDTSDRMAKLENRLTIFVGSLVGIFTLLIAVLLYTAVRAEGIITKQHEVNLELIAAAAQAEAQSRDKSQFLASVSHELRTPLNAVIGFSDIIRNEGKERLEKVHQEYLEDINASGRHLLSLINDILDYSKAEAGKLQMEWAETDATKVIRNSLRMVMPRAEAAQVTLVEEIPPQHLVVVTDAKKLKQVLLNLLSNAVKFTPAGGEVRCHAWVDVVTGAINIEVRDTGIGIAPKDISRVMTPFGQVDSALSRKYEGTGLGLPLSKKFVESMGGTFTIESQLKVGTVVAICIPKAPAGWGTAAMNEPVTEPKREADNVASI
jgi:two-component system cell cycle sensor histidine kinase PleC